MYKKILQCFKEQACTLMGAGPVFFNSIDKGKRKNKQIHSLSLVKWLAKSRLFTKRFVPKNLSKISMLALGIASSFTALAVTPPGTVISNTANITFAVNGVNFVDNSNVVDVTSTIIRTDAEIEQFSYVSSGGTLSDETPSSCFDSAAGAFVPSGNPNNIEAASGVTTYNAGAAQNLLPAQNIHSGDALVIRVQDADQNINAGIAETVEVTVTSSLGDTERVLLTESSVDDEFFIGYIQTNSSSVVANNCVLSVSANSNITINYVDSFDGTDTVAGSVLVDPFGVVFDSTTGAPVDGATVRLFQDTGGGTLVPAAVFDDDGVTPWPNVLTSGPGGAIAFPPGEYRFPLIAPGNYRLVVEPPVDFTAPSVVSIANLQSLSTAPYALLADGSFEGTFVVNPGPPIHIDIPIDPLEADIILEKTAALNEAAIGDFVQYRLTLENVDAIATARNLVINDRLPVGFRYQEGSAYINSVQVADPAVATNGRDLAFTIGDLAPNGGSVLLTYVTEVGAGTKVGDAVNTAIAVGSSDTESNISQHKIRIKDELLINSGVLIGRVIVDNCDAQADTASTKSLVDALGFGSAKIGTGLEGIEGVKIYLEDGTFVTTDIDGKYHLEGLTPGSHVVQLDLESLPQNIEIMDCEKNTRFAKTPYSRFVDIGPGSLWRADFHVKTKAPILDDTELSIFSKPKGQSAEMVINAKGGEVAIDNYRLTVVLGEGVHYEKGSSTVDGKVISDPQIFDTVLIYRLGDMGEDWDREVKFTTTFDLSGIKKVLSVDALATFNTKDKKNIRTDKVTASVGITAPLKGQNKYTFKPKFGPLSSALIEEDKLKLSAIASKLENLRGLKVKRIKVVGHSDDKLITVRSQGIYKDNYVLSKARAQTISDFFADKFKGENIEYEIEGAGPDFPIASNETEEGRSANRRVDLIIDTIEITKNAVVSAKDTGQTSTQVSKAVASEMPKPIKIASAKKLHIEAFGKAWLNTQNSEPELLLPAEGYIHPSPSTNLAIKHHPNDLIEAKLNGEGLNPLFFFGEEKNSKNTVSRSYWQGVHLEEGPNHVEFIVRNSEYKTKKVIKRTIHYSGAPVRVELVDKYSRLVADGVHNPVLALRFYDRWDQPLRDGVSGEFNVLDPFVSNEFYESLEENELSGLDREKPVYRIEADGIALIELQPTTQTGKVELEFDFPNQIQRTVTAWMQPKQRDWVLVGLADISAAMNDVSGNKINADDNGFDDDPLTDGKLSFFAKGTVKGEWLLTAAYNSEKVTNNDSEERLFSIIDPDEYYTLYGDDTLQGYDAASTEKLYIKVEKEKFYALFGDFNTGLNQTVLTKYNRSLTGLKSEYENDNFVLNVFAAETNNKFVKDEIRGNGTSGLYSLASASQGSGLVLNSERIVIEVRDRFQSDVIISSQTMKRHLDYNIDYDNATVFFKQPIANRDFDFNPIFIVADYEVNQAVDGEITAGARAAIKLSNKGEIGLTLVDENTAGQESSLTGIDSRYQVTPSSEITFEYAKSKQDAVSATGDKEGDAYLLQYEVSDTTKTARAYIKETEEDFGLGQQNGSEASKKTVGVEGTFALSNSLRMSAEIYKEENTGLTPTAERDVASAELAYSNASYGLSAGLTTATDSIGALENKSDLLDLGATKKLLDGRLTARANLSKSLGSNNDNNDYSERSTLGLDYNLYKNILLVAEHEVSSIDSSGTDIEMTRLGLSASPWERAQLRSSLEEQGDENGLRVFANLGLTQSFVLTDNWSADLVYERSETISDTPRTPLNINQAPASGSVSSLQNFDSLSFGSTYSLEKNEFVGRVEMRNTETDDKTGIVLGWKQDTQNGLGLAARWQAFDTDFDSGARDKNSDLRLSLAYRPVSSRWVHLNRLDLIESNNRDASGINNKSTKVVNNWKTNFLKDRQNQYAFSLGYKDVLTTIDANEYSGSTVFVAGEYRRDLSERYDLGVQVSTLRSSDSGLSEDSYGILFGWSFHRNTWLTVGYNFEGFNDEDFADGDYSVDGLYMKLRFKFDQDTFGLN